MPSPKLTACAAEAAETGTGGGTAATTDADAAGARDGTDDVGIGGGTTTGAVTAVVLTEIGLGGGGTMSGADRAGGVPAPRGDEMEEDGAAEAAEAAAMVARLLGDETPVLRVDLTRVAAPAAEAAAAAAAAETTGAGTVAAATGATKTASRCT